MNGQSFLGRPGPTKGCRASDEMNTVFYIIFAHDTQETPLGEPDIPSVRLGQPIVHVHFMEALFKEVTIYVETN